MRAVQGFARRGARLVSNLVYREIDVQFDQSQHRSGPVIAVSNHFGGLADGVLLVDAFPRLPRIVARDVIWKVPVAGQVMSAMGGIPVHRRADGRTASNDEMFGSCYEALRNGDLLLIFPEGVTQDVPHIAEVKTGAARIALGARANGASGVQILPVGVHYENKAVFRSRVLVHAGPALSLDTWAESHHAAGPDDREAVQALTVEIDRRLREVAPDFPDWPTAGAYSTAATVALRDVRSDGGPLRYGDVQLIAAPLHRADGDKRILAEAAAYRSALTASHTSDASVVGAPASSHHQARVRDLLLSILLLPYSAIGFVLGLLPWLLVRSARLLPVAPAVLATITPAIAALTFGLEWLLLTGWMAKQAGFAEAALLFLLLPLFIAATVFVAERLSLLLWAVRAGRTPPAEARESLLEIRSRLSNLVWERL